jgi:integrase
MATFLRITTPFHPKPLFSLLAVWSHRALPMAPKVTRRLAPPSPAAAATSLSQSRPPPGRRQPSSSTPCASTRRLAAPGWKAGPGAVKRLRQEKASTDSLERRASSLPHVRPGEDLELAELSDGTTSDEPPVGKHTQRNLLRHRRSRYRLRKFVEGAMSPGHSSFLERNTVDPKSRARYDSSLRSFLDFVEAEGLPLKTCQDWDAGLVNFMNRQFFLGYQAYIGEVVICAVMDRLPEFSKGGSRSLPRAWKSVKGWRRLTPGRSRRAWPWAVWAGMAAIMVKQNELMAAVLMLVAVSTYARPSELFALRRADLHPPTPGISTHWSVRLRAEELLRPTKVGAFDDSLSLDSRELAWLGPVLAELKKGPEDEPLFGMNYPQYVKKFRKAVTALGGPLDKILPYCTRHSGASIDRSRKTRTQEEVARRGRWASLKSTQRYEKAASLTASWCLLTPGLRTWCELCESRLADIIIHQRDVGVPPAR